LVGTADPSLFDNPTGRLVVGGVPPEAYDSVLDFGCGCGRIARQLIQQDPRPRAYLGIDVHRGMIQWCRENLAPRAPGFRFDRRWLMNQIAEKGLKVVSASPPKMRGFQWPLLMTHRGPPRPPVELPEDAAPKGIRRPPLMPADAHKIGT